MSCFNSLFRLLKKLAILVLILAVAIPLRYGSTNRHYLFLRLMHSALTLKHTFIRDEARPTLSSDYRAFENLLKLKPMVANLSAEDPMVILKRMRAGASMNNLVPKPQLCNITKEVFEHEGHTVDTFWVDNHQNKFQRHADHIIVYFHGGGYLVGDMNSEFIQFLSVKTKLRGFFFV